MKEVKRNRFVSILRSSLGDFVKEELELPGGSFCTVSRMELSKKGTIVTAYLSIFPDEARTEVEKNIKTLENRAVVYIKKNLLLKKIPVIRLKIDKGEEMREHIENILSRDS